MGVLTQHCERSLDMPRGSHTTIDDYLDYPQRLTWSDLDAQHTLRMHQMITRDEYLNQMLGNWDEP